METVLDMVGNEEAAAEDCVTTTADPLVYQLVRVDGYGRLVPATEDEVMGMSVEDLLEDDKSKVRIPDAEQFPECSIDYETAQCLQNNVQIEDSEDQPQLKVLQDDAENQNMPPDPTTDAVEIHVQHEEAVPLFVAKASEGSVSELGNSERCPKALGGLDESKTSNSTSDSGLKPDFSLLNGEIHLDKLSVRDLQETFKATFGRETSVKDKQWLKRRIIMGLTNSCDFSTTSFVIIDNRVLKEDEEEICRSTDSSVLVDCVVTSAIERPENPSTSFDKQSKICSTLNGTEIQNSTFQEISGSKDAEAEERPAKRVRKPTKRYIEEFEEFSEGESRDSGAKIASSVKNPACDLQSTKFYARPVREFGLDGRCLLRKDSLGGSGIQVPYVSRIRRSRPRENFMTLVNPSGMSTTTRLEKNDSSSNEQHDGGSTEVLRNSWSPQRIVDPPAAAFERCKPFIENKTIQLEKEVKQKTVESYKTSSDDEVVTVPTANGGIRRKHHRPWTLTEVVKLVEGVAKYGAGRWSEIKRLAFASYSYRTSVDLKDKWRNLLRASVAELPTGNGMQSSRKPGAVPIPAPILSRVRELAHANAQLPTSSIRHDDPDYTVHETRSGFL